MLRRRWGVPLSIYTHEQYKKGAIENPPFMAFNGNHLGLPKPLGQIAPEELAKYVVGFTYAAMPHEFTAEALQGLGRRFLCAIRSEGNTPVFPAHAPILDPGYDERFYEAVLECLPEGGDGDRSAALTKISVIISLLRPTVQLSRCSSSASQFLYPGLGCSASLMLTVGAGLRPSPRTVLSASRLRQTSAQARPAVNPVNQLFLAAKRYWFSSQQF